MNGALRCLLTALLSLAVLPLATGADGSIRSAATVFSPSGRDLLDVYVGAGCFWHVQHELVAWEQAALGRAASEITSLVGYAGAAKKAGSASGPVCYNSGDPANDYGMLGHTEVVALKVPRDKLFEFLRDAVFPLFSASSGERSDPQDVGAEYRSALFLPFGGPQSSESATFGEHTETLLRAHAEGRKGLAQMELQRGAGSDGDTLGKSRLWVLESDGGAFPFHRAEVWHQFHDDMRDKYPTSYHDVKSALVQNGRVKPTGCPER